MALIWGFSLSQVKEVWGSAFLRFHSDSLELLAGSSTLAPWGNLLASANGSSLMLCLPAMGLLPHPCAVNCAPAKDISKSYPPGPVDASIFGNGVFADGIKVR